MGIKTLDIERLHENTGNTYEMIAILSKRSRQISADEKMELDEKLRYFEGYDDEEDIRMNEEQEKICKIFEEREHPCQRAVEQMQKDRISYRRPEM